VILNWKRIAKWCLLGAIVMLIWLMVPVVRCSVGVFRDAPLQQIDGAPAPSQADRERVEQGKGFAYTLYHGAIDCYDETPLMDQGVKSTVLIGFAGLTLLAYLLHRMLNAR
jgi:hypothetical protein